MFSTTTLYVTVVVESCIIIHDHSYSKCGRESYIIHDHTLWKCGRGLFTTHVCKPGSWIRYFPRPQFLKCGRGKSGGIIFFPSKPKFQFPPILCFSRASHSLSLRRLPPFFPTVSHPSPLSPTVPHCPPPSLSLLIHRLALPPSSPTVSPLEGKGCSFFCYLLFLLIHRLTLSLWTLRFRLFQRRFWNKWHTRSPRSR